MAESPFVQALRMRMVEAAGLTPGQIRRLQFWHWLAARRGEPGAPLALPRQRRRMPRHHLHSLRVESRHR